MAKRIHTIYALSDPRTGEIRYIGRTCVLDSRMRQHANADAKPGTPLCRWLEELKADGLKPVPTELAHTWHEAKREVETVAASLFALTNDLVNVYQTSFSMPYTRGNQGAKPHSMRAEAA